MAETSPAMHIIRQVNTFFSEIRAIADLVNFVAGAEGDIDSTRFSDIFGDLPDPNFEQRTAMVELLAFYSSILEGEAKLPNNSEEAISAAGLEYFYHEGRVQTRVKSESDFAHAGPYLSAVAGALSKPLPPERSEIVRKSLLTQIVSAFEVHLGALMRIHLSVHRKALGADEKEFSLADLLAYGSIEEAVEDLVDRRVEDFTRRGLEHWASQFERLGTPKMRDLAIDWDTFVEVLERRNAVVHHNSTVSRQYVARVREAKRNNIQLRSILRIDVPYLNSALPSVLAVGVGVGCSLALKLEKSEQSEIGNEIVDIQYSAMTQGWWSVAEKMGGVLPANMRAGIRLRCQVNSWISGQELNGPNSNRAEIERWDTSALAPIYKIAQRCLLGDYNAAVPEIIEIMKSGDLSEIDLRRWPLFKGLRENVDLAQIFPHESGNGPAEGPESLQQNPS
ncbi:hypothetical protein [Parafrankia irregularis]|nr:hypothetical protein [Parafrankia irregularis]MBE3203233.1 hypothetical protein [Parafrankia sp. CH37]